MRINLPKKLQLIDCINVPQVNLTIEKKNSWELADDFYIRKVLKTHIPQEQEHIYPQNFIRTCILLKLNSLTQFSYITSSFLFQLALLLNSSNDQNKLCRILYSKNQKQLMSQIISLIKNKLQLSLQNLQNILQGNTIQTATLIWAYEDTKKFLQKNQFSFAFSFLALGGLNKAFTKIVHSDKNHAGQAYFADRIFKLTQINQISTKIRQLKVQDPYSMRCCPQVTGVAYDLLQQIQRKLSQIMNRPLKKFVRINDMKLPNLCVQSDDITLKIDFLCCIIQEIGAVSFLRSQRILNSYLGKNTLQQETLIYGNLSSMMNRAIHLTSQNKLYCRPTNFDTMNINNYQNDIYYGTNSYVKFNKIMKNLYYLMGLQIMSSISVLQINNGNGILDFFKCEETKKTFEELRQCLNHWDKGKNAEILEKKWKLKK